MHDSTFPTSPHIEGYLRAGTDLLLAGWLVDASVPSVIHHAPISERPTADCGATVRAAGPVEHQDLGRYRARADCCAAIGLGPVRSGGEPLRRNGFHPFPLDCPIRRCQRSLAVQRRARVDGQCGHPEGTNVSVAVSTEHPSYRPAGDGRSSESAPLSSIRPWHPGRRRPGVGLGLPR